MQIEQYIRFQKVSLRRQRDNTQFQRHEIYDSLIRNLLKHNLNDNERSFLTGLLNRKLNLTNLAIARVKCIANSPTTHGGH